MPMGGFIEPGRSVVDIMDMVSHYSALVPYCVYRSFTPPRNLADS